MRWEYLLGVAFVVWCGRHVIDAVDLSAAERTQVVLEEHQETDVEEVQGDGAALQQYALKLSSI